MLLIILRKPYHYRDAASFTFSEVIDGAWCMRAGRAPEVIKEVLLP